MSALADGDVSLRLFERGGGHRPDNAWELLHDEPDGIDKAGCRRRAERPRSLFEAAYPDLRKLARSRLRDDGRNIFLETTALVHESYLRLLHVDQFRLEDRRAFFAYASKVTRSVVIDAVRERQAEHENAYET